MKSASQVSAKWGARAGASGPDYAAGSQGTTKDQSAAAIAAKAIWQAALTAAFGRDAFSKGLQRSGRAGWLAGVLQKGEAAYSAAVGTPAAQTKYATNSGKFDAARGAASSIARGPKGSQQNLSRVAAVVNALHAAKVGS